MNIKQYFEEIWQQQDWWKAILLTGLIALIPVVGQIYLIGWFYQIFSWNYATDRMRLPFLPSRDTLRHGFMLTLGIIFYFLLFIVIAAVFTVMKMVFAMIPLPWLVSIASSIFDFLHSLTLFIGSLAVMFIFPTLVIAYDREHSLKDLFNFNGIYRAVTQNLSSLATFFVIAILSVFISSLGASFFGIGVIFTVPFATAFFANALADIHLITVS